MVLLEEKLTGYNENGFPVTMAYATILVENQYAKFETPTPYIFAHIEESHVFKLF